MGVPELLTSLRELYSPKRLLTTPAQLTPFESDALTAFRARPEAVVLAETQQELIDTVRLCHREGVEFLLWLADFLDDLVTIGPTRHNLNDYRAILVTA